MCLTANFRRLSVQLGEDDAPRPCIPAVVFSPDQTPSFALVDQIAHGLFAHAGGLRQVGQARPLQRKVPRDVDVCCADLVSGSQIGQGQWHLIVVGHQVQNPRVKTPHGMTE